MIFQRHRDKGVASGPAAAILATLSLIVLTVLSQPSATPEQGPDPFEVIRPAQAFPHEAAWRSYSNAVRSLKVALFTNQPAGPTAIELDESELETGLLAVIAPLYPDASNRLSTNVLPALAFDFGREKPTEYRYKDKFALVAEGYLASPVTGDVVFHADSDDGIRLWVGNFLVIDSWRGKGPRRLIGKVTLPPSG